MIVFQMRVFHIRTYTSYFSNTFYQISTNILQKGGNIKKNQLEGLLCSTRNYVIVAFL